MSSIEARVGGQRPLPDRKISYEEFLEWLDEDTWAEWVDGVVELVSPASRSHQRIFSFLNTILGIYVKRRSLGEVLPAPFQVKLGPDLPGREPDLLFIAASRLDRLHETWFEGAPDLIVEIVSPESGARDRGTKYYEYEAAGVREYWLVDPVRRQAEFHALEGDGRYRLLHAGGTGIFHSVAVPGFWLDVAWLWREPLPDALEIVTRILEAPAPR